MNNTRYFRLRPFIANARSALANGTNYANKNLYKKENRIRVNYSVRVIRGKKCNEGSTLNQPRLLMKRAVKCLTALLLQYNSRAAGGEVFLEEGRRITRAYGQACMDMGFSLREVIPIFLFYRRSILAAIHHTAHLDGSEDPEGQLLFCRTEDFMDELIITLIGSFHSWEGAKNNAVNPTTQL